MHVCSTVFFYATLYFSLIDWQPQQTKMCEVFISNFTDDSRHVTDHTGLSAVFRVCTRR